LRKIIDSTIYLRADEELIEYIAVKVKNNYLYIEESGEELFALALNIPINEPGKRKVDICLQNNTLSVNIDNKEAVRDLPVSRKDAGYIYLEAAWSEYGYSQRNLADDVYDGVFEDLVISEIGNGKEILYRNKLQGSELIKEKAIQRWNKILNWFIKNL